MQDDDKKIGKKKPSKKDDKTVNNQIDINPTIDEAVDKTVVVGWGRMNPITSGHEILVKKIKEVARKNNATPVIYLTHSQDPKKNPLSYNDKVRLAQKAFGSVVKKSNAKTIMQAMADLEKSYSKVILVVGSDRIKEFETLLNKYNGKEYTFKSIDIVSAGERADPDSDAAKDLSAKNMSASVMRKLASADKRDEFKKGLPAKLKRDADAVFDMVRAGMQLAEELEAEGLLNEAILSYSARIKRGQTMKRFAGKIAAARKRMANRRATPEKLKARARKAAIGVIRAKVAGEKGKSYNTLSTGEKIAIDKKVEKRKGAINRIAKKMLPKVRKAELQKFSAKKESFDVEFEALLEARQDSDIGDRKGAQPAKYHAGLEKSTKEKRDAQFKKQAKMDDDNPDAYKPAPGDKEAKTKESEHTKKYRQMYGEASEADTKSKKRYHQLLSADTTVKHDKRFKRNRKMAEDAVDRLKKSHDSEKDALKREQETEIKRAKIRALRKEDVVEISSDKELLEWIEIISDEISTSIDLDEAKSMEGLKKKAEKSGMPYGVLKKVYDRGVAAWRTGHRPGTTPQQWGYARVNSFITKSSGTWGKADSDLAAKVRSEETEQVSLDYFFNLDEQLELVESTIIDKAIAAIHKHVTQGVELGDISFRVSRAAGVNKSGKELERAYIKKHGQPAPKSKSNPKVRAKLMKKYGSKGSKVEEGAGEFGSTKLAKTYKKDTPGQNINEDFDNLMEAECDLIGMKQIKEFERVVDKLFKKFGIDFNFTKHFGERMSDSRNTPCISLKELADFIKKVYAKQGKSLKDTAGAEAVIKDMQTDLNIPVAVKYDQRNDEFDVVMKTIMRKKNFKSPDKIIKY